LLTIDNQIDQTTGTFRLKAVFDNKESLICGQPIRERETPDDVKKNATLIRPRRSARRSGTFVYRVNPADNTAEVRPVTVGP